MVEGLLPLQVTLGARTASMLFQHAAAFELGASAARNLQEVPAHGTHTKPRSHP
jgi:hypothetical protein